MSLLKRIFSKVNRKVNYALYDVKTFAGLHEKFFKNARGARIVCYHGICQKHHLKFNNIFLTLKIFEEHLQFYKKYFHVISLDDYYEKRFSDDKFNVCITFDDGYQNNYRYVLPLVKKYELPVTFFITAIRDAGYDILWNDFLGIATKYGPRKIKYKNEQFLKDRYGKYVSAENKESLAEVIRSNGYNEKIEMMQAFSSINLRDKKSDEDFWLQMTPSKIKELSECRFCTVGSHGYYHNDLAKLNIEDANMEMLRSKQYLENITDKEITALAFPYGTYSRSVVDEAKKVGYSKLLALDFHFDDDTKDPSMRERLIVNPYISTSNQMISTIKRKYFSVPETKEYTIERLNNDNLEDVEKLYAAVYGMPPADNYFRKKYNSSYTGVANIGYIAYNKERIAIAYYGVIPCFVEYKNKIVLAAQSADTMTHPAARYKGLFVELSNICFNLCRENGINLVFGFPNQNSYHGAINKLGWRMTETMDCFIIPVKTIHWEKFISKFFFLKSIYENYKNTVLKKYLISETGLPNSVVSDGFAGVHRSKEYLKYKTYSTSTVINVKRSKAWIKIKNGLIIGDMEVTENDLSELMNEIKKIATKLGLRQIHFHACKETSLHNLFIRHYQPMPSFPVLFQDFGSEIPLEKIKFTFADIDIF